MVLAISFLEAPLKFRAPGVTTRIGLGIGRLVFRALNAVEVVLAVAVALLIVFAAAPMPVLVLTAGAVLVLAGQLVGVRPSLNRRTSQGLAGGEGPRSRAHARYVALEAIKVALAVSVALLIAFAAAPMPVLVLTAGAVLVLAGQLVGVRPSLNRRTAQVLAGAEGPRSRAHAWYVALEVIKVALLVALGVLLIAQLL